MKSLLAGIRWIMFIPAGFTAGCLASILGNIGSLWFPDIIRDIMCGLFGTSGTILGGLLVSPRPCSTVKWIMVFFCYLIGLFSFLVGLISSEDQVRGIAVGITVCIAASAFATTPVRELVPDSKLSKQDDSVFLK